MFRFSVRYKVLDFGFLDGDKMAFPPCLNSAKSNEERVYFARLAALNAALEAARAGTTASDFGHRALTSDTVLASFLYEIQSQKISP